MTAEELEALLAGAEETDRLEFKGPMSWNKHTLAKDILALANVQDGGTIVIGIEDETLVRQGVTVEQSDTYVADHMRDQIAEYADPEVRFSVRKPTDHNGLRYVVIQVAPFETLPVICKKDGRDVEKGSVYFRSPAAKPQSARISNSTDMRRVIERSVAKRWAELQQIGLAAAPAGPAHDYDQELGGL
ncbi:ATP-binding protein [Mesorhizobium sp. B2-4-14]|uniref:AlbA family DNA-binding domain-containing protein n=1 Tax=Mesorhizobium sp. B2-4-14 TaxID=2589935 RepID=UPI001125C870|nr:ATP-binding protein [Mesorhizobium sp. B2-4-14]TPL00673.1 ATP-binding protein [Mesorhizobium sp. B2-4-14]